MTDPGLGLLTIQPPPAKPGHYVEQAKPGQARQVPASGIIYGQGFLQTIF
jgi:hypothetical protein